MIPSRTSLVDILRWRAINQPHRLAYRFLVDGEQDEVVLDYGELDRKARSVAGLLQSCAKVGDRALLLFPPGLDFVVAYFGCLYARVIAIPAYPPHPARPERNLPVILRISADATPVAALLTASLFDSLTVQNLVKENFSEIKLLVTDNDEVNHWSDKWQPHEIGENDLAFLQYTSGSTSLPKGVMVSHGNLIHNLRFIEASFGLTEQSKTVFWLPPYHDMGLIGGILQALFTGYPVTLLPHLMFLQKPIRWLQAISRFKATCSGGPNFAYDLCTRKVKPEQREKLDLSSWNVAFNGAEPVYHKTLDQFTTYFAPCGFLREAFLPCYGLAEATLMVAGGPGVNPLVTQNFMNSELEQNRVFIAPRANDNTRTLVSCGQIMPEQKILIVNAESMLPCTGDEIGEIWVKGPCVASGYWNKPNETENVFKARLANSTEGSYLRTGDLGFFYKDELFVSGRLKNLIIVEGKNHYPHDIERTIADAHPALKPGGSAVFSIAGSVTEKIIIIAEIEQKLAADAGEIINTIREAVSIHHDLKVHDIKLTKPGGISRTTSGKIKHYLCKTNYLAGSFTENMVL